MDDILKGEQATSGWENVRIKHTMTDASDLEARYSVDQGERVVRLEVGHIDTYLLLSFLLGLRIDGVGVLHPLFHVELLVAGAACIGRIVRLPEAIDAERYTIVLNPSDEE